MRPSAERVGGHWGSALIELTRKRVAWRPIFLVFINYLTSLNLFYLFFNYKIKDFKTKHRNLLLSYNEARVRATGKGNE